MCVSDAELRVGMSRGLDALRDEVSSNGTDVDRECLAYVLDMSRRAATTRRFRAG